MGLGMPGVWLREGEMGETAAGVEGRLLMLAEREWKRETWAEALALVDEDVEVEVE